jgi:hypothetical protein
MKYLIPTGILALLLVLSPAAMADSASGENGSRAAEATIPAPVKRGRLRFRDGPVCMCSQGMSEEDIQRAEQARRGFSRIPTE